MADNGNLAARVDRSLLAHGALPAFQLPDGRTVGIAHANLFGNSSVEGKFPLKGWKNPPKRALINFNYDVLAAN